MYLQTQNLIHTAFVLCLFVLHLFTIMLLTNLHHINLSSSFLINALWLAAFYCANSLFLMGVSFFIYILLIYIHLFRNTTRAKNKDWVY